MSSLWRALFANERDALTSKFNLRQNTNLFGRVLVYEFISVRKRNRTARKFQFLCPQVGMARLIRDLRSGPAISCRNKCFGIERSRYGWFWTSAAMECRYYLPFLTKKIQALGVHIVKQTITSLDEVGFPLSTCSMNGIKFKRIRMITDQLTLQTSNRAHHRVVGWILEHEPKTVVITGVTLESDSPLSLPSLLAEINIFFEDVSFDLLSQRAKTAKIQGNQWAQKKQSRKGSLFSVVRQVWRHCELHWNRLCAIGQGRRRATSQGASPAGESKLSSNREIDTSDAWGGGTQKLKAQQSQDPKSQKRRRKKNDSPVQTTRFVFHCKFRVQKVISNLPWYNSPANQTKNISKSCQTGVFQKFKNELHNRRLCLCWSSYSGVGVMNEWPKQHKLWVPGSGSNSKAEHWGSSCPD